MSSDDEMTEKEVIFYTIAEDISEKLTRIIEILERQGSVRPG